jgi:hypothetical protein
VQEIRFEYVFKPKTPQKLAGIRMLPPISEPTPMGEPLREIKAASPPELPPDDLSLFQGFIVLPQRLLVLS